MVSGINTGGRRGRTRSGGWAAAWIGNGAGDGGGRGRGWGATGGGGGGGGNDRDTAARSTAPNITASKRAGAGGRSGRARDRWRRGSGRCQGRNAQGTRRVADVATRAGTTRDGAAAGVACATANLTTAVWRSAGLAGAVAPTTSKGGIPGRVGRVDAGATGTAGTARTRRALTLRQVTAVKIELSTSGNRRAAVDRRIRATHVVIAVTIAGAAIQNRRAPSWRIRHLQITTVFAEACAGGACRSLCTGASLAGCYALEVLARRPGRARTAAKSSSTVVSGWGVAAAGVATSRTSIETAGRRTLWACAHTRDARLAIVASATVDVGTTAASSSAGGVLVAAIPAS